MAPVSRDCNTLRSLDGIEIPAYNRTPNRCRSRLDREVRVRHIDPECKLDFCSEIYMRRIAK